jgi:hypothetical protein
MYPDLRDRRAPQECRDLPEQLGQVDPRDRPEQRDLPERPARQDQQSIRFSLDNYRSNCTADLFLRL